MTIQRTYLPLSDRSAWKGSNLQHSSEWLYLVAAEVDTKPLAEAFSKRIEIATDTMFASAADAKFNDLAIVNLTLLTSLFGTVCHSYFQMCGAWLIRDVRLLALFLLCFSLPFWGGEAKPPPFRQGVAARPVS